MSVERLANTIVAPITAIGGAVAVVRLSGPRAWDIGSKVFSAWPDPVVPRTATYGVFCNGDDGFVLPFSGEKSFTGEEAAELSIHGSHASVSSLVRECLAAGARMAEPGEFTLRAFLNGRIDLTEAEGIRDTVNALTDQQLRQANLLRDGALRQAIEAIKNEVEGVLVAVEASTDFSEDIGGLDRNVAVEKCRSCIERINDLLQTSRSGRIVRNGLTVAISGLPNAGKSSLFNAVLGCDRAIVTEIPGTTRDTVEEHVFIDGLLCKFIDTAGLRETKDIVEQEGMRRTHTAVQNADLVWYVFDATKGWTTEDDLNAPKGFLPIRNKCDLEHKSQVGYPVSAKTKQGISDILDNLVSHSGSLDLTRPSINDRHSVSLREAKTALRRTIHTLSQAMPDDLAAVDLRAAIRMLGEITGDTADPDVIERIFADFCIGK